MKKTLAVVAAALALPALARAQKWRRPTAR